MIIAVPVVRMVQMSGNEVIVVVAVRDGFVPAIRPVNRALAVPPTDVWRRAGAWVLRAYVEPTFVDVTVVSMMEVAIVQVVDVTSMVDGRVAAVIAVDVVVMVVCLVGHVVVLRIVALARRFAPATAPWSFGS
jgi:hypothetical protein